VVVLFYRKRQEGSRLEQVVHDRTLEMVRQDELLHIINDLAAILLSSDTDELKDALDRGVEMIAKCVDVDRVYVWQNTEKNNRQLYYTMAYAWSKAGEPHRNPEREYSYQETFPNWLGLLSGGKYINSPVSGLDENERVRLTLLDVKSILVVPLFLKGNFWGFASFDDCRNDRSFPRAEETILRSGSLMIVNAILRNEMEQNIKNTVAKLEAVVSNYSGIIWSVDREGTITLFNGLYLK
jgi:GAF domain-containing protein